MLTSIFAANSFTACQTSFSVMGGEEALDRIKAIRPGVPVIISTGYGEMEAARHFVGKDMAGLLEKPYTVNQLMDTIAVVLGRL